MTTFQEREQAFEAKFAHDEEFAFRVTARRDKLFAHWAAERLHLSGEAEAALIASVLAVRDGAGHDELLLRHVAGYFPQHAAGSSTQELAIELNGCAVLARQQLLDSPARTLDAS